MVPKPDIQRLISLALAHDLVEIHSGDTFVYGDQKHIEAKAEREAAARIQLANDWPDFVGLHKHIQEYADKGSPEAKFVYALDKLLPPIINYLSEGKSWHEHGVTIEMFKQEKEKKIPKDSEIYPYYQEILAFFETQPKLFAQP